MRDYGYLFESYGPVPFSNAPRLYRNKMQEKVIEISLIVWKKQEIPITESSQKIKS